MRRRLRTMGLVMLGLIISGSARAQLVPNPSPERAASFGWSVGISGDYAIVGAPFDDDGVSKPNAGIAYIYKRNGEDWEQQKVLRSSDLAASDNFGYSVSISGDYAVVGAPYDDNTKGMNAGAVYVFNRQGTNWVQVKKLLASDGATEDGFGWSVGISGTQVVGSAPFEDNASGEFAGAAYVFGKSGTNWPQQKKLVASDGAEFDQFGQSVSISGNYVLVGSPYQDGKGNAAGAVYLFNKGGSGWTQVLKRTVGDGAPFDHFGQQVAISGDFLAVGAPHDDTGKGEDSGSMYLFRRNGTGLVQEAKKTASDGSAFSTFGASVAVTNGYVVAGAPYAPGGGKAYVFKRVLNNGTPQWQESRRVTNSEGGDGDLFGYSVAITGTYALLSSPAFGAESYGRVRFFNYLVAPALSPDAEGANETAERTAETLRSAEIPASFVLHGNYPNPFNPSATIRFDLPETADVTLEVVNLAGQLVLRRAYGGLSAGANRSIEIDGSFLSSGTYLYRLMAVTGGKPTSATGHMVLIK